MRHPKLGASAYRRPSPRSLGEGEAFAASQKLTERVIASSAGKRFSLSRGPEGKGRVGAGVRGGLPFQLYCYAGAPRRGLMHVL
jgi:hypothetical protein